MTTETKPLDRERLRKMDAYWRTATYLAVGQTYLYDNPLLNGICRRIGIGNGRWRDRVSPQIELRLSIGALEFDVLL